MTDAPSTGITATDFVNSLNGFDEIAIKQTFGHPVDVLTKTDKFTFLRSLAFVWYRRQGQNDVDAKRSALELTLGAVGGMWADEPDETMPDEPDSPVGKDV